jgi:hypothetical protein
MYSASDEKIKQIVIYICKNWEKEKQIATLSVRETLQRIARFCSDSLKRVNQSDRKHD